MHLGGGLESAHGKAISRLPESCSLDFLTGRTCVRSSPQSPGCTINLSCDCREVLELATIQPACFLSSSAWKTFTMHMHWRLACFGWSLFQCSSSFWCILGCTGHIRGTASPSWLHKRWMALFTTKEMWKRLVSLWDSALGKGLAGM